MPTRVSPRSAAAATRRPGWAGPLLAARAGYCRAVPHQHASSADKAAAAVARTLLADHVTREDEMTQHAMIRGEVCFRAGDGVLMPVPDGDVDIDVADDSVTLHWRDGDDAGSAAITRDEYDRYVREGKIRVTGQ
jgi:hypothetical protein